jgi:hypothetical protein
MANYPQAQKTLIIREINANTYDTLFDYWFDTQRLKHACDELHTVWSGPPPKPSDTIRRALEQLND